VKENASVLGKTVSLIPQLPRLRAFAHLSAFDTAATQPAQGERLSGFEETNA
jgi:hypothetical protein